MICAACGETTSARPCGACGRDPLLADTWQLDGVLGRGATGVTFRASGRGETVAIKELPVGRGLDAKTQELFEREARVLGELRHPRIPRLLDFFAAGTGPGRALYLVQELVEGPTLAEELASRRFSEDEVVARIRELAGVLAHLHELSPPVVHRDLKPQNVICSAEGLVLIDFGSVRDVLKDLGGSTVAGTFGYMAPELFAGDAGPGADVYALGATAVAMLTRRDPQTLLGRDRRLHWQMHASVSPPTAAWIERMLAEEPAERPSAQQVTEGPAVRALVPREPTDLEPRQRGNMLSVEIDGEVDPDEYGRVVRVLERELGMTGQPAVVGRSLRWRAVGGRHIELRVEAQDGRTELRLTEHHGGLAGGLFGGLGGGVGGGLGGGLAAGIAMSFGAMATVAWVLGCVFGSLGLAGALFWRIRKARREQLQALLPTLVRALEDGMER